MVVGSFVMCGEGEGESVRLTYLIRFKRERRNIIPVRLVMMKRLWNRKRRGQIIMSHTHQTITTTHHNYVSDKHHIFSTPTPPSFLRMMKHSMNLTNTVLMLINNIIMGRVLRFVVEGDGSSYVRCLWLGTRLG